MVGIFLIQCCVPECVRVVVPSADMNLFFSNKNATLLLKFGTLPEEEKIQKKLVYRFLLKDHK